MAAPTQSRIVCFGLFEADLERRELRKSGARVKLHDQPFQILTLLIERAGEVVTREEIRQTLWPGNTFVEFDNGLNVAVKKLRTALCDDADTPRFVETVPKRGYRFVAPISVTSASVPPDVLVGEVVPSLPIASSQGAKLHAAQGYATRHQLFVGLMFILLALAGIAVYRWRASLAMRAAAKSAAVPRIVPRRSVAVLGFRNASSREDSAWLSTALAEMLSSELAAGDRLRMVSGEDVAHLHLPASAPGADSLSKETSRHLHDVLATELLVSGSYTVLSGHPTPQLRLDVRLQDAATGEILSDIDLTWGSHPQAALAACEEARQMFLAAGDRRQAAITLRAIADRYSDEGHNAEALPVYQEVLGILRQIGDQANSAAVLNNMGTVLESDGDLDRAEKMFREAAQAFKATGENDN